MMGYVIIYLWMLRAVSKACHPEVKRTIKYKIVSSHRGDGEKQLLIATLISKIVHRGDINFEHIEISTMIHLLFALLTVWC